MLLLKHLLFIVACIHFLKRCQIILARQRFRNIFFLESMYFLDVSGLSSTNLTIPWTNRRRTNSSSELALDYFRQLDQATVARLVDIYRIDFEMFGYDYQPYLNLLKS